MNQTDIANTCFGCSASSFLYSNYKHIKIHFICVRECVRAFVRSFVCVRACVCVCVQACGRCACVRACLSMMLLPYRPIQRGGSSDGSVDN